MSAETRLRFDLLSLFGRRIMKDIGLLISILLLVGCSDANITTVQNSIYESFPQYTIGQAFSNRKVCKDVAWKSYKGDRGATVVEYTCSMAGVEDHVSTLVKNYVKSMDSEHARTITSIEKN